MSKLFELQEKIEYRFKNINFLKNALTHSSFVNENSGSSSAHDDNFESNERMEFLGDSVLGIVISEYIYMRYKYSEGELTKLRSRIVCEQTLSFVATELDIGTYMYFGKGEEKTGGRTRISTLADAVEAIIAAVFLDSDLETTRRVVLKLFEKVIDDAIKGRILKDYKSAFQEYIQNKKNSRIDYKTVKTEGPEHNKKFYVDLLLDDVVISSGFGKTKKDAQQEAAKDALLKMMK